jgi:hypothetical protein
VERLAAIEYQPELFDDREIAEISDLQDPVRRYDAAIRLAPSAKGPRGRGVAGTHEARPESESAARQKPGASESRSARKSDACWPKRRWENESRTLRIAVFGFNYWVGGADSKYYRCGLACASLPCSFLCG